MYSIILLLIFLGEYLLYKTSSKLKQINNLHDVNLFKFKKKTCQILFFVCIIGAWLLLMTLQSWGTATFVWIVFIMGIMALIVFISPFKVLNYKHIVLIFLISVLVENLFFNYAS